MEKLGDKNIAIVGVGGKQVRNINELIGIIKGIDFDGIINEKEIVSLRKWVDGNRNLAYDQNQIELIRLVDDVLEDNVITDDERERLLNKTRDLAPEITDDMSKIYELNGIITGVVCDGEVNEAEVLRLKKWMDDNGDLIRDHEPSKKLCETIDNILEDGIVTEEEQGDLLEILTERIKDSQFESKLQYLCKLVKERKNIGVDLIDILDNESALKEIHKRAEAQLLRALHTGSIVFINQEIVVVSLVLIAMLEYDGNYYDNVREIYKNAYLIYNEQKVEGYIRSILNCYRKNPEEGNRVRIINVALENSIVPRVFLANFFEFVFDIYKMNFEYDLPENLYDEFLFVYEGLRNNLLSEGDDISLNVTQKTYKLIAATKKLITKEDGLDAIIKLSILIVKLIDKRYWNQEIKIFNPYLKEGYTKWESQLSDSGSNGRSRRRVTSEFRSRWESKFVLSNNNIYLVPPIHKIKSQYDYADVAIVVLNDGVEIYRNSECFIKEIIGGYQITPERILIGQPLGKLTYKLVVGSETIYDSKNKLYRDYIVFDENGDEIKNNTDYQGTAFFCYRAMESNMKTLFRGDFYSIGYQLIREGDVVGIGNDVFSFSKINKPGIVGELYKSTSIRYESIDIPVFKTINSIYFEADRSSGKFEIIINGRAHKISDFQYKVTERENSNKYVVDLDIKESGIYDLEVNQIASGKMKRIHSEMFGYDPTLEYKTEWMDDVNMVIEVASGFLSEKNRYEIQIEHFCTDLVVFDYNNKLYTYDLPLDCGIYSLDGGPSRSLENELWIGDISLDSELRLFDSECDEVSVYGEDGHLLEEDVALKDRGTFKTLDVGFLNSYKNENRYVLIAFVANGKKKYTTICYNKCIIDEEKTQVMFSDYPRQVVITPSFHGGSGVFIEIMNSSGEKIYQSKVLKNGQTDIIENIKSFEEYTINFHEKTKMLMLRKNTLLYQIKRTFYAKSDFAGRSFKIQTAYFNTFIRGEFEERTYHFSKAFLNIEGIRVDGKLQGKIFVKTKRGEWYLNGINPVEVEICSDVMDDSMDVYMTNHGDGLLLDFERHGILNSLEHPSAPDIYLYTINMKEEVSA